GVERCGPPGGVGAEGDADDGADDEAGDGPAVGEDHRQLEPDGDAVPSADADSDTGQPSELGQHDGLEEELPDDVALPGPDGFAHTDLARSLRDADQHDVHDADAGGQEGDGADDEGPGPDRVGHLGDGRQHRVVRVDLEIYLLSLLHDADSVHS